MNRIIKTGLLLPFITLIVLATISYSFYGELFLSFLPYAVGIYFIYMVVFTFLLFMNGADIKHANAYWVNWLVVFMIFLGIFSFYFDLSVNAEDNNSKPLKVVSANIWYKNTQTEEIQKFLENENADIVMLTEFTNDHFIALQDYFDKNYDYQSMKIEDLSFPYTGKVVFSRYPLRDIKDSNHTFDELFLENNVDIDGNSVELVMVHTTAPVNENYFSSRNAQLEYFQSEIITNLGNKALITGDFNISPWSPRFLEMDRQLNSFEMNRVHTNEFDYTWKYHNNGFFKSHIDHTYTSEGLSATSFEYKEFPGSDHKAQVFTLVFE